MKQLLTLTLLISLASCGEDDSENAVIELNDPENVGVTEPSVEASPSEDPTFSDEPSTSPSETPSPSASSSPSPTPVCKVNKKGKVNCHGK